jgi:Ca2+-binding EF-hand superfamily protein
VSRQSTIIALATFLVTSIVLSEDDAFVKQLSTLDNNKDGLISESELPEHMIRHFAQCDRNKDGGLNQSELKGLAAHFTRERLNPANAGKGEKVNQVNELTRGQPSLSNAGGSEGKAAAQFVERALKFDKDKDGKLNRTELMKFAEDVISKRGKGRGRR